MELKSEVQNRVSFLSSPLFFSGWVGEGGFGGDPMQVC